MRQSVKDKPVIKFLVSDTQFPRSIAFCLQEMKDAAKALPRSEKIIADVEALNKSVLAVTKNIEVGQAFRDELNELQIAVQHLHFQISTTWFLTDHKQFAVAQ